VPSGARVLEGARELGTTPFQADLPGPAGERTFVFRLAGYRDAPVVVRVEGGARVEGRLDRIAAVAPSSVRRPAAAPSVAPAPARPAPARTFRPLED
jgi:hypothetical protein